MTKLLALLCCCVLGCTPTEPDPTPVHRVCTVYQTPAGVIYDVCTDGAP